MYRLRNCHLSELAVDVDVDGASLEVQLHRDDAQKTKHREANKPQANQSRYRRPTPYAVEHYRHEGDSGAENDESPDDSADDSPRGRSRSSTFTPTRTRAPTPHPRASESRPGNGKKTVRWTEVLEQESPEQKSNPAPVPSRKKSAMKKEPAIQEKEDKSTKKEEDRLKHSTEAPPKPKSHMDEKATSRDVQPFALRRDRRSSIPRPKFTVTVSRSNTSKRIANAPVAPERPSSPLIPQAIPAPLRVSQRRSIPPSASAPVVTGKAKHDSSAIKPSDKNQPVPTSARDFSFDAKPEVITVGSRSAYQSRPPSTTTDNLPTSRSTSYLQAKPRRNGTIRPAPSKAEHEPARTEDRSAIKPTTALPESSSTKSFHSVKNFWTEKSASANDCNASKSVTSKPGQSTSKPLPATSTPAIVDVPSSSSGPAKSTPLPSSTSTSSFHSVKDFWSGISASSSCGAIVDGSISKPAKPDLPKTSMVSSLAKYTVNGGTRPDEKHGARKRDMTSSVSSTVGKNSCQSSAALSSSVVSYRTAKSDLTATGKRSSSKIPLPKPQDHSKPTAGSSISTASKNSSSMSNSSTYHTANSHLSGSNGTSASDTITGTSTPMAASSTSIHADSIPTIQSELWNVIMDFCRSDSSSPMPGEQRYCDCDDCVLGAERDVAGCSTVARVGEGKKCRARRE